MKGTAESAGRSPGRPAESRSLSSAIVTPDGMASKTVEAIVVFMHSTQDRTRHIETDAPTQQIVRGGLRPQAGGRIRSRQSCASATRCSASAKTTAISWFSSKSIRRLVSASAKYRTASGMLAATLS